jgi:RIO kinase 1
MKEDYSALKKLIEEGEFSFKETIDKKTASLVFDRRTMTALYEFMNKFSIDYIDFPISSGKESVVFKAYSKGKPVVIKVYKMSTLKFANIGMYIEGDYRFAKEKLERSRIVYIWAKKEYTNLKALNENNIPAPKAMGFHKNLLLMSYIGTKQKVAPLLHNISGDFSELYDQVSDGMVRMYNDARIIHADLSEYNILYYRKKAYFIDLGQAVSVKHPSADFFLDRDIKNIVNFFTKKGVKCSEKELSSSIRSKSTE